VRLLAEALARNKSIHTVDITRVGMGFDGACELARALERNTTITSLNLVWNNIGDHGARCLARALEHNEYITMVLMDATELRMTEQYATKSINTLLERNKKRIKTRRLLAVYLCAESDGCVLQAMPFEMMCEVRQWMEVLDESK